MNMTTPMQHGAWLNILLAVFIILELGVFIAWLHYMNIKMLVLPLTRILAILRKNARHVLNSVESEVCELRVPLRIIKIPVFMHLAFSCMLYLQQTFKNPLFVFV